jgi:hypothetical protein
LICQVAVETSISPKDLLWLVENEPDLFATTVAYLEWRDFEQKRKR